VKYLATPTYDKSTMLKIWSAWCWW